MKPLLHDETCPVAIYGGSRDWVDGDEHVCTCDLKERIKDPRALDTRTMEMPFEADSEA